MDEWKTLPWWQQDIYIAGMVEEAHVRAGGGGGDRQPRHAVVQDDFTHAPAGDLRALGVTVT